MDMVNLISKRVAERAHGLSRRVNNRLPLRVGAGIEAATAIDKWEGEGGASARGP